MTLQVDIWIARLECPEADFRLHERLLSADERARADRFVFAYLRRSFILSRSYTRQLLGRYAAVAPRSLEFAYTDRGKPFLRGSELRFNISHSGVLMACAITSGTDVGIDIEEIQPVCDVSAIAGRFFAQTEIDSLDRLPDTERQTGFFRCWTRKEAFVKATGEGLNTPLCSFAVSVETDREARFLSPVDVAAEWQLHPLRPSPGYVGAVAWRGQPGLIVSRAFPYHA